MLHILHHKSMMRLVVSVIVIALLSPLSAGFTSLSSHQKRSRVRSLLYSNDLLEDTTYSEFHQPIHNIVRDLNGRPLTNEYFAQHMGIDVESYSCPEEDAFRGFMSNACRVKLMPSGDSAFYKCIIFKDIGHAWEKMKNAPFKLLRDIHSYQVVASFLNSKACQQMVDKTGIKIPICYHAELEPNYINPMESKFSFLLEDLNPSDGWYQQWLIDSREECKACLRTYAKIHAFFWHGSNFWKDKEAAKELEASVWQSGSYVQPHAQPPDQYLTLETEWARKRMKFEKHLSSFDYWENLGERLQSVAHECGRRAHPFAEGESLAKDYQRYRTFTHGDPKQANIFFHRSAQGDSDIQVGLIDFQWSGFGLAASDVAHFLSSAVYADLLEGSGEKYWMEYYYDHLQEYLVEYGAFESLAEVKNGYSWEVFTHQYETAVLDLCRLIIGYTWDRFKEPVEKGDEAARARTMNKTSYNKSIPNAVWLMSRCDSILKSRGV
jgi:thiamine kinase-like enzyme